MDLKSRIDSFGHAFRGLTDLLRTQPNAQIHAVVTVCVVGAGWWFHLARWEWVAIVLCIALVLAMEAMNTALEYLADQVSTDRHPLIGKAKDVAAAAVFLCALGAVVVGLLIFIPKIL
jgi:diacylglycerol kinase